jgi:thiamine kinase-like enzyme
MDALSVGAVHAARQVAEAHGITVSTAEVIADGSNLLVHLKPAPLLARVATTSALLRRPVSAWLGRDVSVAGYLHAQGAPVAPPSDLLPPGPHQYDGYTMSFWQWVEHDPSVIIPTAEAGAMLRDLHETLRGYRTSEPKGELPLLEIFNEITRWLKFLEGRRALSGGELIQLRETHWRLAETLRYGGRAIQPIHGDSNRKNLLKTEKGWLWTDFEDACGGPTAWDVACLVRTASEGVEAALASYPGAPTWDELLPYLRARELEAVVYWQLQAQRFPDQKTEAHARLREWQRRQPHSGAFGQ